MSLALPRFPLAYLPTPLEPLPGLTKTLGGPPIFIKRDDQTGLAGGGNKTRKLEYLVAEAQAQKARTLITGGAPQSNHCRQTAAAAARAGLRCVLVLGGPPAEQVTGNILLDKLLGAEILWCGERPREEVMAEVFAREKEAGNAPYLIPIGGSNWLGAAAYAQAMHEMAEQVGSSSLGVGGLSGAVAGFDRVVFATSSGGTHAGLALGARMTGFAGQVLGISVDERAAPLRSRVAALAGETAARLGLAEKFGSEDIIVNDDYLGAGYARPGEAEREAIRLAARCDGVLVDPVYTGRALAGLIGLIRKREIAPGERVLFWHTGGAPALFAFADQLI